MVLSSAILLGEAGCKSSRWSLGLRACLCINGVSPSAYFSLVRQKRVMRAWQKSTEFSTWVSETQYLRIQMNWRIAALRIFFLREAVLNTYTMLFDYLTQTFAHETPPWDYFDLCLEIRIKKESTKKVWKTVVCKIGGLHFLLST